MTPLLFRGIVILLSAVAASALIVIYRDNLPFALWNPAGAFIGGMLLTAIIVVIRLYQKRGAKLVFPWPDDSPSGCLILIVLLILSSPAFSGDGGVSLAFIIGCTSVAIVSFFAVGVSNRES